MATIYTRPGELDWPVTLLASVMREDHPALADLEVKVDVLLADSATGPAVTHGGYPALAKIRVLSLKDRVRTGFDAELVIDEARWGELDKDQQGALLDHELEHLRPILKKAKGEAVAKPQYDALGRPKLRTAKGDWNCGDGFAAVVARRGEAAVEFLNAMRAHQKATEAMRADS